MSEAAKEFSGVLFAEVQTVKWFSKTHLEIDGITPAQGYTIIVCRGNHGNLARLCEPLKQARPSLQIDEKEKEAQLELREKKTFLFFAIFTALVLLLG